MRTFFPFFTFLTIAALLHAEEASAPFTVAIVPSKYSSQGPEITIADKKPDIFYVVLKNISKTPQPVWITSNSWGFWTISFEFVLPNGKKIFVTRNSKEAFTVNFPGFNFVPAGESQVYPIRLDKEWDSRPNFEAMDEMSVIVKAVYEVQPTAESKKYKVWTGRVASKPYKMIARHW